MKPETIALHAGYDGDPTTNAATTPIYQTTSYTFDNTQHGADLFNLAVPGNIYSRIMNPTNAVLEQRLTELEGGVGSLAVASGMAAIRYSIEAIAAVDQSLDLGQFDNDGPDGVPNSGDDDGTVDSVFFLYHEVGAHCGGTGPWPHFGGLAPWNGDVPYASDDARPDGAPVEVNGYVLSTAVDCAGQDIGAMPVASHELGHVLGLPDFYHPIEGSQPTERRWVLGCWDLMAAGAWGCGPSDQVSGNFGPTGFAPWSKERLGWLEVQEVESVLHEDFVLEPVQSSGRVLKLPLDGLRPPPAGLRGAHLSLGRGR